MDADGFRRGCARASDGDRCLRRPETSGIFSVDTSSVDRSQLPAEPFSPAPHVRLEQVAGCEAFERWTSRWTLKLLHPDAMPDDRAQPALQVSYLLKSR